MGKQKDLQYFVELFEVNGNGTLKCWVDTKVSKGDKITLRDYEDPEMVWLVFNVYENWRTRSELNGSRGWKVGGLK